MFNWLGGSYLGHRGERASLLPASGVKSVRMPGYAGGRASEEDPTSSTLTPPRGILILPHALPAHKTALAYSAFRPLVSTNDALGIS